MSTWETIADHYRQKWEEHYGATAAGASWERYEPRYQFAWEMGSDPEVQGKSWVMAQPALRRKWEERFTDQAWDQASDTGRLGGEHAAARDIQQTARAA